RLGLAPIGPVLAATVAETYPVASASSSIVYRYDPTIDAPVLRPGLPGPIFGERAETVGQGRLDLTASYSFVRLATINGEPLDDLVNQRTVGSHFLFFPVSGGVILKDGRFTTVLPVHATVDIGVDAHILSASLTYGVTPDLDVNVTLPVIRTSLDLETTSIVPDPRFPSFPLKPGGPLAGPGRPLRSGGGGGRRRPAPAREIPGARGGARRHRTGARSQSPDGERRQLPGYRDDARAPGPDRFPRVRRPVRVARERRHG